MLRFSMPIVPTARLFAEHITRDAIAKRLGWHDLEFVFTEPGCEERDGAGAD